MKMIDKPDLQNIGNAGEYFMASVLSSYGFTTTITLGRAEAYDLIAISPKGKTIKLQVKTSWYKIPTWRMGDKNEEQVAKDFFYAFIRLNERKENPEFWIVPSEIVAPLIKKRHALWLSTLGKKGQAHNDNPGRMFGVEKDKYFPEGFDIDEINRGHNSLEPILKYDKQK